MPDNLYLYGLDEADYPDEEAALAELELPDDDGAYPDGEAWLLDEAFDD